MSQSSEDDFMSQPSEEELFLPSQGAAGPSSQGGTSTQQSQSGASTQQCPRGASTSQGGSSVRSRSPLARGDRWSPGSQGDRLWSTLVQNA